MKDPIGYLTVQVKTYIPVWDVSNYKLMSGASATTLDECAVATQQDFAAGCYDLYELLSMGDGEQFLTITADAV